MRILKASPLISFRSFSSGKLPEVFFEENSASRAIHLNRLSSLNAYNQGMVLEITSKLNKWKNDDEIKFITIEGEGNKAFCAGGDIIHLCNILHETTMHYKVATFSKPIFSFVDGIAMGGGMGLCLNSSNRIITERCMFAMPETRIGYFPDAGALYYLSKLPGYLGLYLALTGHKVRGEDALSLGFGDHMVNSQDLDAIKRTVKSAKSVDDVHSFLDSCSKPKKELEKLNSIDVEEVNKYFSAETMIGIMDKLSSSKTSFAKSTFSLLSSMSPIALVITYKAFKQAETLSFKGVLELEYGISEAVFGLGEFKEGVRALLIDKDNNPCWNPSSLETVSNEVVDAIFAPENMNKLVL